jgi:hypothetical protein
MATVTLAESAKLTQDQLVSGLIESIVEVNPLYEMMPFTEIEGNAIAYNRENALGDTQFCGLLVARASTKLLRCLPAVRFRCIAVCPGS